MISNLRLLQWATWTVEQGPSMLSDIAPLLRRRMSPLARMVVATGLECCRKAELSPTEPRVVFACRHGEMGVTVDLLRQMAAGETLSPTGFSNSVHHAAVGYWSLATGNRQAMRAVAGGDASFCYGFLDAIGMLGEADQSPVLLIAADEPVPPPFGEIATDVKTPFAVALLLERASMNEAQSFSFDMGGRAEKPSGDTDSTEIPAMNFLQWHLKGEGSLELVLAQRIWRWSK